MISEHGTMSYSALVLDGELKDALAGIMGKESLTTEKLEGFSVKTHAGTGISVLVKDTEVGRGGTVLLQTEADRQKYEALAEEYFYKYPNLVKDKTAAYIRADLEIKGLMERTGDGILKIGFDGITYDDNTKGQQGWSILFSPDRYEETYEWLHRGMHDDKELQSLSSWLRVLNGAGRK